MTRNVRRLHLFFCDNLMTY